MTKARMTLDNQTKAFAKEVVRETLLAIGIDVTDPEELVRMQADRHYVRSARLRSETIGNNSLQHTIFVVISGVIAAALIGAAKMFGVTV